MATFGTICYGRWEDNRKTDRPVESNWDPGPDSDDHRMAHYCGTAVIGRDIRLVDKPWNSLVGYPDGKLPPLQVDPDVIFVDGLAIGFWKRIVCDTTHNAEAKPIHFQ